MGLIRLYISTSVRVIGTVRCEVWVHICFVLKVETYPPYTPTPILYDLMGNGNTALDTIDVGMGDRCYYTAIYSCLYL